MTERGITAALTRTFGMNAEVMLCRFVCLEDRGAGVEQAAGKL